MLWSTWQKEEIGIMSSIIKDLVQGVVLVAVRMLGYIFITNYLGV